MPPHNGTVQGFVGNIAVFFGKRPNKREHLAVFTDDMQIFFAVFRDLICFNKAFFDVVDIRRAVFGVNDEAAFFKTELRARFKIVH